MYINLIQENPLSVVILYQDIDVYHDIVILLFVDKILYNHMQKSPTLP